MVRKAAAVLLLVGAWGFLSPGHAQVSGAFSVVLERDATANKWSLECPDGCPFKWGSTTVIDPATPMRLDNRGLRTEASNHPADVRFSIKLTPRGNGWVATSALGTLWTELSIDCPSSPCRATVTERGVGLERGRR